MEENGLVNNDFVVDCEEYLVRQLVAQVEEHEGCDISLLDFHTSLQSIESIEKVLYLKLININEDMSPLAH